MNAVMNVQQALDAELASLQRLKTDMQLHIAGVPPTISNACIAATERVVKARSALQAYLREVTEFSINADVLYNIAVHVADSLTACHQWMVCLPAFCNYVLIHSPTAGTSMKKSICSVCFWFLAYRSCSCVVSGT